MRALRIHARGGPEALVDEEAPVPEPAIGDVLVRVGAASFTPTELAWPSTWVDRAGRDRTPVIPAHEVCGIVQGLGYGTTGFELGDVVYGLTDWYRDGAAAEYVAVEARNLAPKPAALDETEAAATPMPALTARQALLTHGALAQGQTVLVLGAGGGVGSFAVQLARVVGASVIAAARSWARDAVLELGADQFIDVIGSRSGLRHSVSTLSSTSLAAIPWPVPGRWSARAARWFPLSRTLLRLPKGGRMLVPCSSSSSRTAPSLATWPDGWRPASCGR